MERVMKNVETIKRIGETSERGTFGRTGNTERLYQHFFEEAVNEGQKGWPSAFNYSESMPQLYNNLFLGVLGALGDEKDVEEFLYVLAEAERDKNYDEIITNGEKRFPRLEKIVKRIVGGKKIAEIGGKWAGFLQKYGAQTISAAGEDGKIVTLDNYQKLGLQDNHYDLTMSRAFFAAGSGLPTDQIIPISKVFGNITAPKGYIIHEPSSHTKTLVEQLGWEPQASIHPGDDGTHYRTDIFKKIGEAREITENSRDLEMLRMN